MTQEQYKSKSQMKRVEILKAGDKTMTHEELLAKINEPNYLHTILDKQKALRAVVELHPMIEQGTLFEDGDRYGVITYMCAKCNVPYPCEDIQAIEKELA